MMSGITGSIRNRLLSSFCWVYPGCGKNMVIGAPVLSVLGAMIPCAMITGYTCLFE